MSRIGEGKTSYVLRDPLWAEDVEYASDVFMIAAVRGVGNTGIVTTQEGAVVFDIAARNSGVELIEAIRAKTQVPIHTIIYSHHHGDHAGRTLSLFEDAMKRGNPRPRVIAHENLPRELDRYKMLAGWRQYAGGMQFLRRGDVPPDKNVLPLGPEVVYPDITYSDAMQFKLGGLTFEVYHYKGETNDGTWLWVPERKTAMIGGLGPGICPNPGSPFKVQRYAAEWIECIERVAGKNPDFVVPGHGRALRGHKEVQEVCLSISRYLRSIHNQVVSLMNEGYWLEDIMERVKVPEEVNEKWWLKPVYGCPAFTIRDIHRRYSGWYDGTPSHLLPSRSADIAAEVVKLGGIAKLMNRVRELKKEGKVQLALHLAEFAAKGAAPAKRKEALALNAEVLDSRADIEPNFIAKNILLSAAERAELESKTIRV